MFGRDPENAPGQDPARSDQTVRGRLRDERRVAAWIGALVVIQGNVTSSEDLTIAGRVEGDVSVPEHGVVIASEATIGGDIAARAVAVHGRVVGTITADQRIEIGETAAIEGDITAPRIAVSEGAVLHGRVTVRAKGTGPAAAAGEAASAASSP